MKICSDETLSKKLDSLGLTEGEDYQLVDISELRNQV
jgi:hypothetical protein